MGIEVRGNSGWNPYYDPEVYTATGWKDILFGEIYTGTGPIGGWSYFYVRINVVNPVISFVSRTQTSITVNVSHSNPDSDRVRVYIYRVGAGGVPVNGQYVPNSSGTTGTINQNYTQSGLQLGTNYTFGAYAEYLDANGNIMITSDVVQQTYATSTFDLYTPSTPSLTNRGYNESGGVYTGTLTFQSSSNPLFSTNGSTAYIQFQLTDGFSTTLTLNSANLSNNDSLQSRSVTFTGLNLGSQWLCRARTIYTTISEQSDWSAYSAVATTVNWERIYVPSQTTWVSMQGSGFSSFVATASSSKSGGAPANASDGSTSNQWASDPNEITQTITQQSRNITTSLYTFGTIRHDVSGTHNIANPSTSGSTAINSLTFALAGKCFTNTSYIVFEISDAYSILRGNGTINGSGLSGVDGVSRTILTTQPVTGGVRQILFARPTGVAVDQISSSGTLFFGSSSTINGVSISSLGGSGTLFYVDSNTFDRAEPSNPGEMPTTTTSGTVTYDVVSNTSTPKGPGLETLTLFAAPSGMSSPRRNVRLESVYYKHGTITSSDVDIRVNGNLIASGSRSADSILLSPVAGSNIAPNYTSSGLSGGNGWYLQLNVQRGVSGSSYVSTVSEVQLRYSYEVLV